MALNGYIPSSSGGAYSSAYVYYIKWSAEQDITNNQYKITAEWVMKKVAADKYGSYNNYENQSCVAISIAGQSSGNIYKTFDLRNAAVGATLVLATYSRTVDCEDDGSLSVAIKGSHYTGISWGTKTTSATVELDTIPRASVPSVEGTLELGGKITINSNRKSSDFIHNLYYSWGSEITNKRFATGIGASTTWTIPKDLANHIMYGLSGILFITCETYNGSTKIGDKTISVTVSVPDTAEFKPSISDIEISENSNSGVPSSWGIYVQSKSKLDYKINAFGAYSSIIKSYKVVVNGITYNKQTDTTDLLKMSGTNSIVATVTDSRGRTATLTKEFEVVEYIGPTITNLKVNRCNEDGTLNKKGLFAKVEMAAEIDELNNNNTYSYLLKYRKTKESQYTDYAIDNQSYSLDQSVIIEADENSAYDFMLIISDYFTNSVSKNAGVSAAFRLWNANASGKGFAFGKMSEKDALEINMAIYDRFDQLINNGLAEYNYGTIDANTTLSHLCLTETNTPNENGFYYIMTMFYGEKSVNARRTQIAFPYIYDISQNKKEIFIRQNVDGVWNDWTQI